MYTRFLLIDQDVGDRWILEQRLERPEAEDFVQQFRLDPFLFRRVEQQLLLVTISWIRLATACLARPLVSGRQLLQIQLRKQRCGVCRL